MQIQYMHVCLWHLHCVNWTTIRALCLCWLTSRHCKYIAASTSPTFIGQCDKYKRKHTVHKGVHVVDKVAGFDGSRSPFYNSLQQFEKQDVHVLFWPVILKSPIHCACIGFFHNIILLIKSVLAKTIRFRNVHVAVCTIEFVEGKIIP